MSNTSKGNLIEIEVKNILERLGWMVFRQHRKPMFMKGRMITAGADIFGCDMVAKKEGQKSLWIQVSTKSHKSDKLKQIMKFPWTYEFETAQIWLRTSGERSFEIYEAPTFIYLGKRFTNGEYAPNTNLLKAI